MSNYSYTQTDFKNATQIDINDLQNQINNLALTSAQIQYINFSSGNNPGDFTADLFFNQALSSADHTALSNLIINYVYVSYANIMASISDTRSTGTNGGTFTSGSWITRQLNTIDGSQNFCTLNNNQFTLIPGIYHLEIGACACGVQNHQFRVWDVTDNILVAVSTNGYTTGSNDFLTISMSVNLSSVTTYEIQHQCVHTLVDYGFGRSVGFGLPEKYCYITIRNNSI